jgi:hypothetical protein
MKALGWILWGALLSGPAAVAGGVDGGGGNTRPAHPVTEAEVRKVLEEGRPMIVFLMNSYSAGATGRNPRPLPVKLFAGPVSLLDRLRAVNVSLATRGPCYDEGGNPVDGSANQRRQSVCISLPRLMEKLNRENLRNQTLALVAHEYSHLVGTSEAEAEELQEYVLETLLNRDAGEIYSAAYRAKYFLDDWVPYLAQQRGELGSVGWAALNELLARLHPQYSEKLHASPRYFDLNDAFGTGYLLIEGMRVGLFRNEAPWLAGDRSEMSERNHEANGRMFATFGKPELDGATMIMMLGGGSGEMNPGELDPRFAEVKIERVVDLASAGREFGKIYAYLAKYRADLAAAMRPLVP